MYEIEKNISHTQQHGEKTAFLRRLEIGDSFVVPNAAEAGSLYGCAAILDISLKRRAIGDGRYRMWRIK